MSETVLDPAFGAVVVQSGYAWAPVCLDGNPFAFVHAGNVCRTRAEVMKLIGGIWNREDFRKGWRYAKRRGWRAMRVEVRVAFGGGT